MYDFSCKELVHQFLFHPLGDLLESIWADDEFRTIIALDYLERVSGGFLIFEIVGV